MQPEAHERGLAEFVCSVEGDRKERSAVLYRTLVRNRLRDAVEAALPDTAARLGPERLAAEVTEFLRSSGPRSSYMQDLPSEFLSFALPRWEKDAVLPVFLPDLARYELQCLQAAGALDEDERRGSEPGRVSPESRFRLSRSARLASYDSAVHRLDSKDEEPPAGQYRLLVYRDSDYHVRTLELSPLGAELVSQLWAGVPLGEAILASCRATGAAPDDHLLGGLASLLDDLEQRQVLRGYDATRDRGSW